MPTLSGPEVPLAGDEEVVAHSRQQRDRSLVHGAAWAAGARISAQVVTWSVTLLVARVLSPADYGIEIPLIVRDHIAKVVDVNITLLCDPIPSPAPTATK